MNNNEKLDLIIEELYKIKQNQINLKNIIKNINYEMEYIKDEIEYIKVDLKNKF